MKISKYNIVLGSNSPRRRDILTQMGIKFEVRVCEEEEIYPENLKGKEVSEYLAIQKAMFLKDKILFRYRNSPFRAKKIKEDINSFI